VKIVVVYDTLIRPDTTGTYCENALRRLGHEVIHYEPLRGERDHPEFRDWEGLPEGELYLQIDDDLAYPFPRVNALKVYWCIDVHRMDKMYGGPATRWDKIKLFDRVFSAQRDMSRKLNVPWLPLAYDPEVIHPIEGGEKIYDWCFVGNMTPERVAAVEQLKSQFANCFVGQAYGAEMNRIYNASRLAVNFSIANDINMRFFEAQGSGTPLISNRPYNGEDELFDGMLYFDSVQELPRRVGELLDDPSALATSAQRQQACVSSRHTYLSRMRELLEFCR